MRRGLASTMAQQALSQDCRALALLACREPLKQQRAAVLASKQQKGKQCQFLPQKQCQFLPHSYQRMGGATPLPWPTLFPASQPHVLCKNQLKLRSLPCLAACCWDAAEQNRPKLLMRPQMRLRLLLWSPLQRLPPCASQTRHAAPQPCSAHSACVWSTPSSLNEVKIGMHARS